MRLSRKISTVAPILGLVALAGCGGEAEQKSGAEVADQMEAAADQSDPQAAKVINERADQIRGMESVAPADQAGAPVQETMEQAGAAASPSGAAAQ